MIKIYKMKLISTSFLLLICTILFAQTIQVDLSKTNDETVWKIHNREVAIIVAEPGKIDAIGFNAKEGDGLAIYQKLEFENGTIEFDVKGKNEPGKSFVGVAFHIQDEETFNAVYFRPFNFNNPDKIRSGHSIQYISHPEFTWFKLRNDFPEQFENNVTPVPNPEEWFHAKITVKWPDVRVYVDYSNEPSLDVKMKSTFKKGKIGLWVGNGSDGAFRNLAVTKE